LQECVLVPYQNVALLPDSVSFREGSLAPMAVITAFNGFSTIGLPLDPHYTPADKKGLLIWSGASSVGSATVQIAHKLGYITYVTASARHHQYLQSIGANHVFDYHDDDVVAKILAAIKQDGVHLVAGYTAVGGHDHSIQILKEFRDQADGGVIRLASAPWVPADLTAVEGVEVKFITSPAGDEARFAQFAFVFNTWVTEKLASGEFVPSIPSVIVVDGGLHGANKALDQLKQGVSGTKLLLEL
jgi:NADPH:quinone reductase-like Zn-dependent oxidoreductase